MMVLMMVMRRRGGLPLRLRGLATGAKAREKAERAEIARRYQRKTQREHVLLRPAVYVGQTEPATETLWLYDTEAHRMRREEHVRFVPAFVKLFDEILVNAADHKQRDPKGVTRIAVRIERGAAHKRHRHPDPDSDLLITIENNGAGIPVALHPQEGIYVPELIFGHMLTGSNFNDDEARLTGGRHGYGAKLTNIFSKMFEVVTQDAERGLVYEQAWHNNMEERSEPVIREPSKSATARGPFTRISFVPDLERLGMSAEDLLPDSGSMRLLQTRVVDVAGTAAPLRVSLNGEAVPVRSFCDYVNLFPHGTALMGDESEDDAQGDVDAPVVFSQVNPRWELAISASPHGSFEQISFVNNIATHRGGTHVQHVTSQLVAAVEDALRKRLRSGGNAAAASSAASLSAAAVRSQMQVFIRSMIENPSFSSQTKEQLATRPSDFGSQCRLTNVLLKRVIAETGIVDALEQQVLAAEQNALVRKQRKAARGKGNRVQIPKLEDAHAAGTERSADCTLILTEGDSAKALAVAGLEVVGRKLYGVFPLKGKLLNVREASARQIGNNDEIMHLTAALGLEFKTSYRSAAAQAKMRYGQVLIMTDQDEDGVHIQGLIINFLHSHWPELLERDPAFVQTFRTPLIKAKKKKTTRRTNGKQKRGGRSSADAAADAADVEELCFYTTGEFERWLQDVQQEDGGVSTDRAVARRPRGWTVKYYKGLGTSTAAEGREYFRAMESNRRQVVWGEESNRDLVPMVFSKSRVADRKKWILDTYAFASSAGGEEDATSTALDPHQTRVTFDDFINKDLVRFSHADNVRSIPSVVDGLKPSQRKVLYSCFRRNLTHELKVAQLAGYCAEHSAYHHGEASLYSTIIHMAQDFVGANNLPLLEPRGQFGTRLHGGRDAASPRYIFTCLSPLARLLFPAADDELLERVIDDGEAVEPVHYLPTIPMLLVNGSQGIGTGWSTNIPAHNPLHVVDVLLHRLAPQDYPQAPGKLVPWWRAFKGEMVEAGNGGGDFVSKGRARRSKSTLVEIDELPVGRWAADYKEHLLKRVAAGEIRDVRELHTVDDVHFKVDVSRAQLQKWEKAGLTSALRLQSPVSLRNMHAFSADGRIQRYDSAEDILSDFFDARYAGYEKRRELLRIRLIEEHEIASSKARFVAEVVAGDLELDEGIERRLGERGFHRRHHGKRPTRKENEPMEGAGIDRHNNGDDNSGDRDGDDSEFQYLLNMPLRSLTPQRQARLVSDAAHAKEELCKLEDTSAPALWQADLQALRDTLVERGDFSLG